MSVPAPAVTIRFICEPNKTDGSTDDVAQLLANADGSAVRIIFVEKPQVHSFTLSLNDTVNQWLPMLFDALTCDEEPFSAVQIDTIFAPSLLVRVAHLSEKRARLVNIIQFALRNASSVETHPRPPLLVSPTETQGPQPAPTVERPVSPTLPSSASPTQAVPPNLVPRAPPIHRATSLISSPLGLPSDLHSTIHLQALSPMRQPTIRRPEEEPVALVLTATTDVADE
jgi:hypothetical protein